ncbi:hypothetical protein [Kytococcus sedentarius]|uniref:hypothetical protein n=1 Tax=Kytococcus sedentarius TaxID=1276 RepID=UPI001950C5B7|nr:hypothetical protein [Kytococcus sedentarius]QRO87158.1 hypothetical protein I6J30_10100 [Kytococcus sedentarius]
MRKFLAAATLVVTLSSAGVAVADPSYSRVSGGHAANSSGSDYNTHVYVCDTADDGHEMEAQMRVGNYTTFKRDSAGGSCGHSYQTSTIKEFRACRLELFDTCGGWVRPQR